MCAMQELESRTAAYLEHRLPGAEEVRVDQMQRIHGGASRQTYRLRLTYTEGGRSVERRLVLRRDPPGSLIETERECEFMAIRAFYGSAVPVPEPLWLEPDPKWLDHPFFIMEELVGFEPGPTALFESPYAEHREKIADQKWTMLGEISKLDPIAAGLLEVMQPVKPDECWQRELGYWEGVIDKDEMNPQPVVRAAIRWLRRNPPAPAQRVSVVHADMRTGNYLCDTEGNIRGILDWEMAHLGDPLEDLAWSLNRVWCWGQGDDVGGLVPKPRAIEIWERSSGLRADPDALHWWELFSSVKAQAIWLSSAEQYVTGVNKDPILAFPGWFLINAQDRAILETMEHLT
jgi:aminoglycoside phosphotransferase (APT) family kinase protein